MSNRVLVRLFVIVLLFLPQICFGQTLSSSNLPIFYVSTSTPWILDEPKIEGYLGIIDNGPGQENKATDPRNGYTGDIGIERRGSSSQSFPKGQYSVELWLEGVGISAPLLDLPAEEDWIFFAPYNDKSLMRDVLAYKMGRDMGRYAPRTRYFELVLNGQYEGVYVLIEKIKRDKNRVDIANLDPTENSGDALTGGYILKIDKLSGNGGLGFQSKFLPPNRDGSQVIYFQYEYPESITTEQRDYISNYVNNFEAALASETFADPLNGYAPFIDVQSFIDFMIMNEVSKNVDGYRLSTYLHKQKKDDGGKLVMGPIWDFNLGFGNADYCTSGTPTGLVLDFNTICNGDYWLIPFWWNRLMEDAYFRKQLGERWMELRSGAFSTSNIHTYIDSVANVLNQGPQQRNFERWPVLGTYVWPNLYVGATFQEEVNWLKSWVELRMNWLDGQWSDYVTDVEAPTSKRFRFSLYPNPAKTLMTVSYQLTKPSSVQIAFTSVTGQTVLSSNKKLNEPGSFEDQINISQLPDGMYFVRLSVDGKFQETKKIVKGFVYEK